MLPCLATADVTLRNATVVLLMEHAFEKQHYLVMVPSAMETRAHDGRAWIEVESENCTQSTDVLMSFQHLIEGFRCVQ
eukprot:1161965-Pelagomonas_calceolata.AAC.9